MTGNVNGVEMQNQPTPNRGVCQGCAFSSYGLTAKVVTLTCKRMPPQIIGAIVAVEVQGSAGVTVQQQWATQVAWPNVGKDDWCGEFRPDPNQRRPAPAEEPKGIIQPS